MTKDTMESKLSSASFFRQVSHGFQCVEVGICYIIDIYLIESDFVLRVRKSDESEVREVFCAPVSNVLRFNYARLQAYRRDRLREVCLTDTSGTSHRAQQ